MKEEQAHEAAAIVAVLANAARIRMVEIMLEGELQVSDLAERIGLSQSATSQHLRRFKVAGMLVQRKDEQSRYCTIAPEKANVLQNLISVAEANPKRMPGSGRRP